MTNLFKKNISLCICIMMSCSLFAQISGTSAFIQGNYLELAIGDMGAYISNDDVPEGFHYSPDDDRKGLLADSDKDGWDAGTPNYCGDYFVPGTPVEEFAIQVGSAVYYNDIFGNEIPGEISDYSESIAGGTVLKSVKWEGTIAEENLDIKHVTSLDVNNTWFLTRVYLTNTGTEDLNDIYYSRNTDPDNDFEAATSYVTVNVIAYNHPIDPWALVTAEGTGLGCFLGLGSKQKNAVATHGSFFLSPFDLSDIYNGLDGHEISGGQSGDIAITLTYKINRIRPGQTKVLSFIYGTNSDDLNDALNITTDEEGERLANEANSLNGYTDVIEMDITPNPSNGMINLTTSHNGQLQITNMMGQVIYHDLVESGNNEIMLNAGIANGTYLVTLFADGERATQTIILSR